MVYTEEDLASIQIITSAEAKNAVFAVCPISAKQAYEMTIKLKNPTWVVTFNSDFGYFSYVVDAKTGEILEKDEPEVPEGTRDPMDAARDACLATLDGYDGRAKNMTLSLKGQKHKVVDVEFDWNGEHYSMQCDVSTKTVTTR
ncbi:MAG: PepSY domain-containing protein [Atopobiaceae bacterium]|nr:PepSY domain-containing protein [Atopobiaceae bacterium]